MNSVTIVMLNNTIGESSSTSVYVLSLNIRSYANISRAGEMLRE